MKYFRFRSAAAAIAGIVLLSGCLNSLTPKAADLERVQELYVEEFTVLNVPAAAEVDAARAPAPAAGGAFAQSLRAIHAYRAKYPDDTPERAHLQVLEGMIYLQSGRFGLAAAVLPQVKSAAGQLTSGTGRVVRDRLFAENYGVLLDGWTETRKENNRDWQTFERVANQLAQALAAVPVHERASVEADQGALYLATSAAVFYVWAYRQIGMSEEREQAPAKKAVWFAQARDLIGQYLTDAEKRADISRDLGADAPIGRLRYVQWYHWLDEKLATP